MLFSNERNERKSCSYTDMVDLACDGEPKNQGTEECAQCDLIYGKFKRKLDLNACLEMHIYLGNYKEK